MVEETKKISPFALDGVEYDVLGAKNKVRGIISQYVSSLASSGTGFTFGHKVGEAQFNMATVKDSHGTRLCDKVKSLFYPDSASSILALNKYLLEGYLCYVEVPSFYTERSTGIKRATYNKFLATTNLDVVSAWLGIPYEEAESKYGSHLDRVLTLADEDSETPYLKLGSNKSGRTVTRPKKDFDLLGSGVRIVPLFALESYVNTIYSKLKGGSSVEGGSDIARITFVKDNGTTRVIDTTFNEDYLVSLYKDSGFVSKMLEPSYSGDFVGSSVIDRGYIRVPEVGASIYDGSGVRAVSYTRILGIEYGVEPNMEFAKVDLDGVLFQFSVYINRLEAQEFMPLVRALKAEGFDLSTLLNNEDVNSPKFVIDAFQLENWADLQKAVLSTTFQRQLALFMLASPQWFMGYTGERTSAGLSVPSSAQGNNNLGTGIEVDSFTAGTGLGGSGLSILDDLDDLF